ADPDAADGDDAEQDGDRHEHPGEHRVLDRDVGDAHGAAPGAAPRGGGGAGGAPGEPAVGGRSRAPGAAEADPPGAGGAPGPALAEPDAPGRAPRGAGSDPVARSAGSIVRGLTFAFGVSDSAPRTTSRSPAARPVRASTHP